MPNKPKPHIISAISPPENTRSRNSDMATIGSRTRNSSWTKTTPSTAATAKLARITGDVQPRS